MKPNLIIPLLSSFLLAGLVSAHADRLESDFLNPPERTKPRCYWYWIDGQISREGITRDLEAMKRVGIGEGYIGIIGGGEVKALTEPWWQFLDHAVREGGRIGVDVGLFNCPGWSQSGGPWVKPAQSMRYLVLPELRVKGPQTLKTRLPAPAGDFQDVAVLAFPAPAADTDTLAQHSPQVTGDTKTGLTYQVAEPFTVRSLTITPSNQVNVTCKLRVSDDGAQFRDVRQFAIDRHNLAANVGPMPLAPVTVSIPATTARFFRLEFSAPCALANIELSGAARVENCFEKQLAKVFQDPQPPFDFYTWPKPAEPDRADLVVKAGTVRDLTRQLAPDGTLGWDVPPGEWVVLRAVAVPTGVQNAPAPPEATGLEVDKMNRTALGAHFDAYIGKFLARVPRKDRTAFKHVVADSYEMGPQNWTDAFLGDFQKRYGYDPLPFLPVLTGRMVGSADQSDRFLWDVRRMVADRVARDYVGGLRDLCHQHGLKMWLENYGHWGFPGEFLQYGGSCDEISGEFWADGNLGSVELRDAASAAHIYGMPVVFAEAFTGGPAFRSTPASLKARGDWALCEGINQFVLHVYIHQPWNDRRPGVNAWFGTEFNRNNTWFEFSKPWIDYHRRCSVLLQAGKPVADVAYFIGEDAPKMTGLRQPELPPGYDFDYINADVIQNRLRVKNGRFVLPDGMSYKLLVLPASETMRPALVKKLAELAAAGGAILGPAPKRSPSLQNYPSCDQAVQKLAENLWGGNKVLHDVGLPAALAKLQTPPDVNCPEGILWKHRREGTTDVYFLSNQKPSWRTEAISFRVKDRSPEFWWPETGRIERPAVYDTAGDRVRLPIHFGPNTSVFVLFREDASNDRVVEVTRDGQRLLDAASPQTGTDLPIELTRDESGKPVASVRQPGHYVWKTAGGTARTLDVATVAASTELTGPWKVSFDPAAGGPAETVTFEKLEDWTKRGEEGIRWYSGVATYRKTFELGETPGPLWLDLGDVRSLARVRINGHEIGIVWKQPYRLDIAGQVKPGANTLEIQVVNTWLNRLLGDDQPGGARKWTSATTKTWQGPPQASGLLGPVTLQRETRFNTIEGP